MARRGTETNSRLAGDFLSPGSAMECAARGSWGGLPAARTGTPSGHVRSGGPASAAVAGGQVAEGPPGFRAGLLAVGGCGHETPASRQAGWPFPGWLASGSGGDGLSAAALGGAAPRPSPPGRAFLGLRRERQPCVCGRGAYVGHSQGGLGTTSFFPLSPLLPRRG